MYYRKTWLKTELIFEDERINLFSDSNTIIGTNTFNDIFIFLASIAVFKEH